MNTENYTMTLMDYEESLKSGLVDEEEIAEIIEEMKKAKVGAIKANCWEKIGEDEFIICVL